ncbi:LysR family transcriptional regulator [Hyphomicrobium sp. NDB2Meth4]|uniref:LysR family transcriptional regulator n=1 Tax=Hyphomicrobium sp. NDB2Meth4 TaxID=1892846 RepID=UPI00093023D3|nr:LysR family transcriptional regulator [Hyphomicrobium sp. NDB2Meth4]
MNFKSLRAFQLAAERGSLSAAASELCLSQPAVSRLIALLEADLDLKLFDRTGRGLSLTRDGKLFYDTTKHILAGVEEIPRIARNIRTGDQRFHILTTPRVAQAVVSPALSLLRKSNDRLSCSIDLRARFELDSAIASTRFDLVLASLPLSPSHVPIETKPLFKVRIEAVVPNDHNFAKRGSLTADDLAGETLIGPWRNPAWRQQMGDALPAIDFSPSYALETHSSLMAYQMASDGAGIAFFDRLSARGLNTEAVKFLPLSPAKWITFGYIHPAEKPLSANALNFIDAIRQTILDFRLLSDDNANAVHLA